MGPLQGINVLDLTSMVSGPVAAMMLGDQGADVIKVEPIHGEQLRYLGEQHNDITPTFYSCNRNKKSLAIDLKKRCWQGSALEAHRRCRRSAAEFPSGRYRANGFR